MKFIHLTILPASGFWQKLAGLIASLILLSLALPLKASAEQTAGPVGQTWLKFHDSSRQAWGSEEARPLNLLVWYPAAVGSQESREDIAIFKGEAVATNAPVRQAAKPYPLIVLSHGTGGSAISMAWFGRAMAARGYIVVGMNHHGNTAYEGELKLEGFVAWWDRPRDISVALDKLLKDSVWSQYIDQNRIALAGFSIGGYTVLANAGARADYASWQKFCDLRSDNPNCKLPPEAKFSAAELTTAFATNPRLQQALTRIADDYRDPRVKAVVAMAPVMASAMTKASLQNVTIPVNIVVGSADDQALPSINAEVYASQIPNAQLAILAGYSHYGFLAECTTRGQMFARDFCSDKPGLSRIDLHRDTVDRADEFFKRVWPV